MEVGGVHTTRRQTGLTSLLEANKRPRAAAAALCRCEWRRYQRWMVTAARFTCWMNLQGEGGSAQPWGPPQLPPPHHLLAHSTST